MKIINVAQGSAEWLTARGKYLCASDAPAMMGASKHTKRNELVRMKATGDQKEFSEWAQKNLLDKGHGVEAGARAIVETMLGEELYPVTASDDTGRFLASFDGINMAGDTGFEHKLWNEDLVTALRAGTVPPSYHWQLDHQLIVGGLKRIIFVCSDGTKEKFAHLEYRPDPKRIADLQAGWTQFEADVAAYQHVEIPPALAGRAIPDLPALTIVLDGKVKKSNLDAFKRSAIQVIESINTDLKTDQDFADAAEMVKFCETAEKKLELAKESALAQASSIEEIFRTLDHIRETMRGKRLELDKKVEERKKAIRAEILSGGQNAFSAHMEALNKRLGSAYMPVVPVDFAAAMKGKKSIASLRDAVDTELARGKIAANAIADRIGINLNTLREAGGDKDFAFLFSDLRAIVAKETEDFAMLVKARIVDHRAKEEKRLADDRERIRQEGASKLASQAAGSATTTLAPGAPTPVASAKVVALRPDQRPADEKIVDCVATNFGVTPEKAIEWLRGMDFESLSKRTATTGA